MVQAQKDLTAMTVEELIDLAKREGVSNYSGLRKPALLALLELHFFAKQPRPKAEARVVPRPKPKRRPKPKPRRKPRSRSRPVDSQVEEAVRTIRNAFAAGKKGIDVALFEPHQVAAVRRRLGKKAEIARFALNTRHVAVG